jgi:hypothetical protein
MPQPHSRSHEPRPRDPKQPSSAYRSRVEEALYRREDEPGRDPFRDVYLPWGLIVAGALLSLPLWLVFAQGILRGGAAWVLALSTQVLLLCPLMLATMLIMGRLVGVGLPSMLTTSLRAGGIVCGPAAVVDALFLWTLAQAGLEPWMILGGLVCYAALCGPVIALLFEVGPSAASIAVLGLFLPRLGLVVGLWVLVPGLIP